MTHKFYSNLKKWENATNEHKSLDTSAIDMWHLPTSNSNTNMSSHDTQSLDFVTLDVFTSTRYEGNQLALVKIPSTLQTSISQQQKQTIAREFNLSETVFLHEQQNPEVPEWKINIFITTAELPFAGHPTIGAAYYALNQGKGFEKGVLIAKAGRIDISKRVEGGVVIVDAGIPHNVRIHRNTHNSLGRGIPWISSLATVVEAELNAPFVSIVKGMTFLLVELQTLEELATVQVTSTEPGFLDLLDEDGGWNVGFVGRYYFVRTGEGKIRTRMLEVGFEDPATGSAACALASYLALRGAGEGGLKVEIEQGVEMGRRSVIGVEVEIGDVDGARNVKSVRLSGTAVQVMEGKLRA